MKVAAITVTYNDNYKFKEWCNHYEEYKSELYMHIIVDNGSEKKYLEQVKNYFSNSIIIERAINGGCTSAYNDGIKHALSDNNVDAIMLIGNDIRLEEGGITKLFEILQSKKEYGMIAPLMFMKDSRIIEDFGSEITPFMIMKPRYYKKTEHELPYKTEIVPTVTGGMNIAKREFYEKVGLQDENLFMYSDEVDMGLRTKKTEYKIIVTAEVHSWHQHINPHERNIRLPYSSYLIGRNKVYLAKKHKGYFWGFIQFIYHFYIFLKGWLLNIGNKEIRIDRQYFLRGSINGFLNRMNDNCIIKREK